MGLEREMIRFKREILIESWRRLRKDRVAGDSDYCVHRQWCGGWAVFRETETERREVVKTWLLFRCPNENTKNTRLKTQQASKSVKGAKGSFSNQTKRTVFDRSNERRERTDPPPHLCPALNPRFYICSCPSTEEDKQKKRILCP